MAEHKVFPVEDEPIVQLNKARTSPALLQRLITQLGYSRALRRNKFLLDLMLGQTNTTEILAEAQGLGVDLNARCYLVLFIELRMNCGSQVPSYQTFRKAEQVTLSLIQARSDVIALHKEPEQIVLLLKGSEAVSLEQKAQALAEALRQGLTSQMCTPLIGQGKPRERLQDIARSFDEALIAARHIRPSDLHPRVGQMANKDILLHLDKSAIEAYLRYGTLAGFDAFFRTYLAPLSQFVLSSGMIKYYFFLDILLTTAHFVNGLGGKVTNLALEVAELKPSLQQIRTAEELYTQTRQILKDAIAFRDRCTQNEPQELAVRT